MGLALLILPGVEPDVRQLHELAVPADGEVCAVALGAHELVEHIVGHEAAPPVDGHDLVAGLQAGLAAEGVVLHGIDDLAGDGFTAQRDEEQQHHEAQHEVHHRACRHHQHPLPDSRLVQRLACPLLQHLRRDVRAVILSASALGLLALGALLPFQRHKAAYGQEPQGILCAFAVGLDEGRTHANGKLVDLDPAELCHCKMAELVDGDDCAEDEQRGCKGDEN